MRTPNSQPNRLPDISRMDLTPAQVSAIEAIIMQGATVTSGNTVLAHRKSDALSPQQRRAAHEVRLSGMNSRIRFTGIPEGPCGGRELRRRTEAYYAADCRFHWEQYRAINPARIGKMQRGSK